jgi:phosphatidylglycerol:prolipoprotein diacylglycerol transferase
MRCRPALRPILSCPAAAGLLQSSGFQAMHPVIHHIWGPFSLYSYGLCMAVAIFSGLAVLFMGARRSVPEYPKIVNLAIIVVISGIAGSWLLYVVSNWPHYAALPWRDVTVLGIDMELPPVMDYFKAGMVFYGGVLGALAGGLAYGLLVRLPILEVLDAGAPAIALAHGWGRLGCFLAGCCYGRICGPGAGLCAAFPRGSVAYADMVEQGMLTLEAEATPPVIPTQLMESGFELVFSFALMVLVARRPRRGYGAAAYFIGYALFRFLMEYLRFDPDRGTFLFFTTSQWVSILLVLAGLFMVLLAERLYRGRRA